MEKPLTIRGITYDPPLFCAPMAGITHSAFRRLVASFGGCGGLYTEMLSARMVIHESPVTSPWLKRRPSDGPVIYQYMAVDTHGLEQAVDRILPVCQAGIDLNLACPAATVQAQGGGSDLFDDPVRLRAIIRVIRPRFDGPLLVKIRLGRPTPDWRAVLQDRLRLFEDEGIDAFTLHPRFAEESLSHFAPRHALYAELAGDTRLPIIANGDIRGPEYVRERQAHFAASAGLMIGRMAAARPWVFAQWRQPGLAVDLKEVWERFCDYIEEDFPPRQALIKLKVFTPYFAQNFVFGHTLFTAVQRSRDWPTARQSASDFLSRPAPLVQDICLRGL